MPWNPELYNHFKNIRYEPFFDLMDLILDENLQTAIDIGCGTGEQTKILAETFTKAHFLGIDTSKEMLEKSSSYENERLHYELKSVEEFCKTNEKYDLIFSNAALQWSDNHDELFPKLISKLSDDGQFAVQMPVQNENTLNQILIQLASEEPYKTYLNGFNRISPMLTVDEYTEILFQSGLQELKVLVKVYPIIANDVDTLLNFISGSALIPYLERLEDDKQKEFTDEFKRRIGKKFSKFPAIYPFKRILMYGRII